MTRRLVKVVEAHQALVHGDSRMPAVESARVHRRAVKALVGAALLFCVTGSGLCQIRPEPYTFFKQYMGLKDDQIANIGHGKAVAQVLPTSAPSEIVAFGAIYIKASPRYSVYRRSPRPY
jgi:hypothetical protein